MELFSRACGSLNENCYTLAFEDGVVVVDPGEGAAAWALSFGRPILAILATHGHFDHVFDADELRGITGAKIYLPKGDEILTRRDPFGLLAREFEPDFLVADGEKLRFGEVELTYRIFPGHTPGCAMIELNNSNLTSREGKAPACDGGTVAPLDPSLRDIVRDGARTKFNGSERIYFSGDFIFKNSVGRSDFTHGDPLAMKESLRRVLNLKDAPLYPGHGAPTTLENEHENIRRILEDW